MTEIHFRLPSNLPYAYVEVRGTPEEIEKIDPEALAALFANSMVAFKRGEANALDLIKSGRNTEAPEPSLVSPPPIKGGEEAEEEYLKETLGATEIDNVNEAPYKAPAPAAKPKPWEKEKPKPTVAVDIDGW